MFKSQIFKSHNCNESLKQSKPNKESRDGEKNKMHRENHLGELKLWFIFMS